MIDNGKGFQTSSEDEQSILAPLYQCCAVRHSTFEKLKMLHANEFNVSLSGLLRHTLSHEPLTFAKFGPLIIEKFLLPLDRRISIVLKVVAECVRMHGTINVILT